jgi:hypothetical protein
MFQEVADISGEIMRQIEKTWRDTEKPQKFGVATA